MGKAGKTKNQLADQTVVTWHPIDEACTNSGRTGGASWIAADATRRSHNESDLPRRKLVALRWTIGSGVGRRLHLAELFDVALEQSFGAIRAEAVGKISFRVQVDIGFQLRAAAPTSATSRRSATPAWTRGARSRSPRSASGARPGRRSLPSIAVGGECPTPPPERGHRRPHGMAHRPARLTHRRGAPRKIGA